MSDPVTLRPLYTASEAEGLVCQLKQQINQFGRNSEKVASFIQENFGLSYSDFNSQAHEMQQVVLKQNKMETKFHSLSKNKDKLVESLTSSQDKLKIQEEVLEEINESIIQKEGFIARLNSKWVALRDEIKTLSSQKANSRSSKRQNINEKIKKKTKERDEVVLTLKAKESHLKSLYARKDETSGRIQMLQLSIFSTEKKLKDNQEKLDEIQKSYCESAITCSQLLQITLSVNGDCSPEEVKNVALKQLMSAATSTRLKSPFDLMPI